MDNAAKPETLKSYAQFGEDLQILRLFGHKYAGVFIDVGANDGVSGSNTLLLEQRGWTGILVEPNAHLAEKCRLERTQSIVVECAVTGPGAPAEVELFEYSGELQPGVEFHGVSTVGKPSHLDAHVRRLGAQVRTVRVAASTLDQIIAELQPPRIDFVSIDVEGFELDVLTGFSLERHSPRLIILEDNSNGADEAVRKYLEQRGYIRVHRTGVNDWYVRAADVSRFRGRKLILLLRFAWWRFWRRITGGPREGTS